MEYGHNTHALVQLLHVRIRRHRIREYSEAYTRTERHILYICTRPVLTDIQYEVVQYISILYMQLNNTMNTVHTRIRQLLISYKHQ